MFSKYEEFATDSGNSFNCLFADNWRRAATDYSRAVNVEMAKQRSETRRVEGLYARDPPLSRRRSVGRSSPKLDTS